ncbi:uncharacterized protein DNG_07232 [Cephalotrichum gorgonifer]|uniref:Store-operated calcium entry-associated regulatory factor n=1 Tax=Cephalotrichum gorgonifer TaxID=2041049 RepID=A0AAE8SY07_9PEZI|nr:uncharacterized protein DNG_07232 [Cephalotrichum gorgonifer]
MHLSTLLTGLLPLLLSLHPHPASAARPKNAIFLSEVRTLTLRSPSKTTSRRVAPIPQLKCVSPAPLCALHRIDVMRCTNQGSSYGTEDVEWSCTAELPPELRLGSTEVVCEGYAHKDDPYVLKGSCGVEYRVVLTKEGEARYPELLGRGGKWGGVSGEDLWSWAFGILFVGVLFWILSSIWRGIQNQGPVRGVGARDGYGGGGGWGGPGGWGPGWGGGGADDPPPPYPGHKPAGTSASEQWRPGFWTGLASGAGAGYLAGSRARQGGRERERDWMGGGREGYWGSGWGGDEGRRRRNNGGGGPSSSSSFSSPTRESTGFGSTSRR